MSDNAMPKKTSYEQHDVQYGADPLSKDAAFSGTIQTSSSSSDPKFEKALSLLDGDKGAFNSALDGEPGEAQPENTSKGS